jgi:hypothetical protein
MRYFSFFYSYGRWLLVTCTGSVWIWSLVKWCWTGFDFCPSQLRTRSYSLRQRTRFSHFLVLEGLLSWWFGSCFWARLHATHSSHYSGVDDSFTKTGMNPTHWNLFFTNSGYLLWCLLNKFGLGNSWCFTFCQLSINFIGMILLCSGVSCGTWMSIWLGWRNSIWEVMIYRICKIVEGIRE